jgi:hypothetical protein
LITVKTIDKHGGQTKMEDELAEIEDEPARMHFFMAKMMTFTDLSLSIKP